jgi:hypothetical protein
MKHKWSQQQISDYLFKNKPELFMNCLTCGIKFKKLKTKGGRTTCSDNCKKLAIINKNKGRTQSKETIRKRLNSTNQTNKEAKRQTTMLNKYGKLYNCPNPEERSKKISKSLTGKPRSKEHSKKIIESKRRNGTLNHSYSTRSLISRKLKEYTQKGDDQSINIGNPMKKNGRGHKCGYFNNLYYRSSYELIFLQFCFDNKINVTSAETKEHRIRFTNNNKKHWYYPDFYLTDYRIIVEIKPKSLLNHGLNPIKFEFASKTLEKYLVLTEIELFNENKLKKLITNF